MYARFFGLASEPFSIAPDPRYLFLSERHREALAHLLFGLQAGGGIVLLTGEVGAGKTTVCRAFLEQVPPNCRVAYIFNPKLDPAELLQSVCQEFGAAVAEPGMKAHVDALNAFLLRAHAAGEQCVLVIDEAQSLAADVLEQLRLLTNLETHERKLLQIVLVGQPELRRMLAREELKQLSQRVVARYHLEPLRAADTARYLAHRLAVAGWQGAMPFSIRALALIGRHSRGVPRRINLIADRALLAAYATGRKKITSGLVERAVREVFDRTRPRWLWPAVGAAGFAVAAAVAAVIYWPSPGAAPAAVAAAAEAAPGPDGAAAASAAPVAAGPQASEPAPAAVAALAAASAGQAAPAAPVPATQIRWPAGSVRAADAWRELASLWGATPGEGAAACGAAPGLACWEPRKATLATVRTLGRPGVVTLYSAGGAAVAALLVGLDEASATIRIGGDTQTVGLNVFAAAWQGDFGTYWRKPPGWPAAADPWLGEQLDRAAAAAAPTLDARLRAFQRAHGIEADGRAGAMTVMQLNRAAGIDEPRLASR
jgi:general secretion pathway protein A